MIVPVGNVPVAEVTVETVSEAVSFSVDEFSLEHMNTVMNEDLLKRLAEATDGEYATAEDADKLISSVMFPDKHTIVNYEWDMWNRPLAFLLIVLLFCMEWIMRKRMGML